MSHQHSERLSSVTFSSDDDEDRKNTSMDIEFFTPRAQDSRSNEPRLTTMTTTTTTTNINRNELQIVIPPSTPIRPSSTKRRAATALTTTIKKEIELVDLVSPTKTLIHHPHPSNYIPRTLHCYNQRRLSILPTFPTVVYNNNPHLLLVNVSMDRLSPEELRRREPGKYKCPFTITDNDPLTVSYMIQHYHKIFGSILQRFKLDLAILDHNFARLDHFMILFRNGRRRLLRTNECSPDRLDLDDTELPHLLEFYLQIDVDLFYMKTCSFRDAQPRSKNEGIFCLTTPECRYTLSKCGYCKLCSTSLDIDNRQQVPVRFDRYERHRFVNGYESILNCPATCQTKNFIYVLTCVCGQYDYISETKFAFEERYYGHCIIGNNVIRKFLIGENNLKNIQLTKKFASATSSSQTSSSAWSKKDNMLIYKHSMQCPTGIQMFLDKNAIYWSFVPMSNEECNQDNINYLMTRSSPPSTTTICSADQYRDCQHYLDNIPKPPHGYRFSKRQIEQQAAFFRNNIVKESFHEEVNIYNSTIIAVLPPCSSDLFRQIVHSLFVTHTEAKLNTLGHVFDPMETINIRNGQWCANLVRRSISSSTY